jgi:hypothetical protein
MKKPDLAPTKKIWTYAYQIEPPQSEDVLGGIKTLLDHEHADAQAGKRTWAGRVITEEKVTHIMVVSDNPQQDHEVNRRLEAALKELKVGYSLTIPLALPADEVLATGTNGRPGPHK